MLTPVVALRLGTAAIFLLAGVILVRDRWRTESGPVGGLLAISIAVDTAAAGGALPWLWPIGMISAGIPALLWIWTGTVLVDPFRPSWRDALAWCVLPILGQFGHYLLGQWTDITARAVALLFIGLALWRVLAGLRDDL